MQFEWNEANLNHIAEHGIDPREAVEVFHGKSVVLKTQVRDGENRYLVVGPTLEGRILAVVWTIRDGYIRVVTAFPASRKMRAAYKEVLNE